MKEQPGTIRRRSRGWNVILYVRGRRHEFEPRSEPSLRTRALRSAIEQWARVNSLELEAEPERVALRESLERLANG